MLIKQGKQKRHGYGQHDFKGSRKGQHILTISAYPQVHCNCDGHSLGNRIACRNISEWESIAFSRTNKNTKASGRAARFSIGGYPTPSWAINKNCSYNSSKEAENHLVIQILNIKVGSSRNNL